LRATLLDAAAALLALVGVADSVYLTVEHLLGNAVRCTVTSGCSEVLGSPYASLWGVPLAAFGAAAYFTAFSLATLSAFGYTKARTLLSVLVAAMFATTLWLLYLQAFVLQAFCQFCLLSAAITTLLALIALAQLLTRRRALK
ncbi:MAG TPA: vitamin K epoxide reductase family protein, partial [Pyrinomonadaceae bacterium]